VIDVAPVLDIVAEGATLVLSGPDPLAPAGSTPFAATLESATGARCANAYGASIKDVFEQLLAQWGEQ
jgi:hypothetical protein